MGNFLNRSDEILSVGEFSRRFKMLIKTSLPELWLKGEISNLKTYSSGHTYFTLKDEDASISAVLLKGYSKGFLSKLAEGAKVLVFGEISLYEQRGNYQIVVKAVLEDGLGELAKKFEALKQKLASEGLFDEENKKEIPYLPRKIALVTSPSGAVVKDFVSIMRRRGWAGELVILPSKVQGESAVAELIEQIDYAQKEDDFDLIVLMRGGGSLEDLECFNDETLVRAIAACAKPIISAVGHQTDFTLADFASDMRAETPSAAAEFVSSNFLDFTSECERAFDDLEEFVRLYLDKLENSVKIAEQNLRLHLPQYKIENCQITLDEISSRLENLAALTLKERRENLLTSLALLQNLNVSGRLDLLKAKVDSNLDKLNSLNFTSVLKRGYVAVFDDENNALTSAKSITPRKNLRLKFHDGDALATGKGD